MSPRVLVNIIFILIITAILVYAAIRQQHGRPK